MRKLRVNIFDDDVHNLKMLNIVISQRDYEVLTFDRPVVCPIYHEQSDECINVKPCADIIITDYQMPQMTGIDMLVQQVQRGCKVDSKNKALMSGDPYSIKKKMVEELGCIFFSKPIDWGDLFAWLDACEKRIDLLKPVGIIRKDHRYPVNLDILYTCKNAGDIYKGIVMNYSNTGLCLNAHTPFLEKQSIVIINDLPNGCKKASVCWIKPVEAGSYMVGLTSQ